MGLAEDELTTDEPAASTRPRTSEPSPGAKAAQSPARWVPVVVVIGLVLAALNLRPAISGLGPLMKEVRDGLGMNGTVAGLLTSVPPLCFAIFGPLAPRLARRFGVAAVVGTGMLAITAGLSLRPLAGGTVTFLAATALALAGIAVSNVLMPVVVKQWFPNRIGTMTGLYSMALACGTSLAAAVTVPMTQALGGSWRIGLGAWAVLGALALVPWAAVLRGGGARPDPAAELDGDTEAGAGSGESGQAPADPSADPAAQPRTRAARFRPRSLRKPGPSGASTPAVTEPRIGRSPTAWALAVFFGLQASGAYITMGWLPQIYRDAGVSASTAGILLAVTMGMGIPLSFVLPKIATRMRHQGPLVLSLAVCGLSSYAGLWFAPGSGAWLWSVLLGFSNCAFPVALTLIGMRARSSEGVVKLSAFAQSTGYLISIPGPLLVGALRDVSGGWHAPLLMMAGLMLAQMTVGVFAGRDRFVEDDG